MFLLDTNILVDFLRGRLPLTRADLEASDPSRFKISAVVEAELRYGAAHSRFPERNLALVERLIAPFEVLPFDSAAAREYARIREELAREGQLIGPNDLLIAATASATGATLVTNNLREFRRVRGLAVESWEELAQGGAR